MKLNIVILFLLIVASYSAVQKISLNKIHKYELESYNYLIRDIEIGTGSAIALQVFTDSSKENFEKLRILDGNLDKSDPNNSTQYIWNSPQCILTGPQQRCLFLQPATSINVTCAQLSKCTFSLQIYSLNSTSILNKIRTEINFNNQQLSLLKFEVVSKDQGRLVISTELLNSQGSSSNLTALQFFPNKPIQQIKNDQILSYFAQDQISNVQYALIAGYENTTARINFHSFNFQEELKLNESQIDYYQKAENIPYISYKLRFEGFEQGYTKFIFKWNDLKQGEVNLMASSNEFNQNFTSSYWISSFKPSLDSEKTNTDSLTNKQYSLLISSQTAQKVFQSHTELYLGITSSIEFGFFRSSVQILKEQYPQISLNEIVAGKTEGDIINIQLQIPYSEDESVIVDLRILSGFGNLYLRECRDKYCVPEKFTKNNIQEMNTLSARLENNYITRSISLMPSCSQKITQGTCNYLIGIIPNDYPQKQNQDSIIPQINSLQYQLEIFSEYSFHRKILRENEVTESRILEDDYEYFALYLKNTNSIQEILVRVSSQLVQLYVSVDNRCSNPNSSCLPSDKLKRGINTSPVVLAGQDTQRGVVYVGVYGYSATIFTVVVEVKRVDQTLITELKSGSLYHGQLSQDQKILYFIFHPDKAIKNEANERNNGDLKDYDTESIEIHLRGNKDKLVLFANNDGTMPYLKDNGFIWSSTSGTLFIPTTDKKYKKGQSYNIAVMATEHAFDLLPSLNHPIISSNSLQFELIATVGAITKIIEMGKPIQDILPPRGEKMYEFVTSSSELNLIISIHSPNHKTRETKVNVCLGSFPFENENDFEIKYPFSQSVYEIQQEQLSKNLCKNGTFCHIFIGLNNTQDSSVQYTLTVWTRRFAIELKEGIQHSESLNLVDEFINMYFQPSNQEHSLNVFVSSQFGHTGFNAVLWGNKKQVPSLQFPFPTSNNKTDMAKFHYVSGVHNAHSITFDSKSFKDCWPDCYLLLSISYYKGLPQEGEDHHIDMIANSEAIEADRMNDKFTVLVSSIFADLNINQQLEFTLDSSDSKFFYISLQEILQSKDSVIIELTSLSGRAAMSVVIKDDIQNRYSNFQTSKTSDFISYSNYLRITAKQFQTLIEKYSIKLDQNPQLVVEITCVSQSAGRFVVSAMEGNSPVLDLMHGLPQEVSLLPNQIRFFKYFHFSESDFVIKYTREIGMSDLSLKVCRNVHSSSYNQFKDCLNNNEKDLVTQHTSGESGSTIHISQNDKTQYCQNCLYIIKLTGESVETHAFINILLQQDFTWLQEGRQLIDSVDAKSVNLYRLSVDGDEETHLSLQLYSGLIELKYSYRYSYNLQEYIGPISVSQTDQFLHLTLRPRQTLIDEDDSFNPFNKPQQINQIKDSKNISKNNKDENLAYIEDLSEYFFETEIFVAVISLKDIPSNYSIVFNGGDEIRYIYDGKIMGSSIPPQKKITYLYHYFEDEQPVSLNIFSHSKLFSLDQLELSVYHDLMKNRRDYKDVTRDPIVLNKIAAHDSYISYEMPNRNGTYELVFLNDHLIKTLNISITINLRDILLIPLTYRIEHALGQTSINYYEVIIPKKGYLTLSTIHCAGDFSMGFSQDLDSLLNKEYSSTFDYPIAGSTHVNIIKVKPGPAYFTIQTNLIEAFYKIRPDFFTYSKSIPHDKIVAGNKGEISTERNIGGKTNVIFMPISCLNCTQDVSSYNQEIDNSYYYFDIKQMMTKARVQYDVIYSTDLEILNVLGKCSTNTYYEHDSKNQLHVAEKINPKQILGDNYKQKTFSLGMESTQPISFTVNLDSEESIYFVSIVATVTNLPNTVFRDMVIFYENSKVETVKSSRQVSLYAFIFGCILVIVFFIMTTCLFWKRYKNLEKGLEVAHKWRDQEMQQGKKNQQLEEASDLNTSLEGMKQKQSDTSFQLDLLSSTNDLQQTQENQQESSLQHQVSNPLDDNPFDKIQIKIAPPPQQKKGKYDQLVEED